MRKTEKIIERVQGILKKAIEDLKHEHDAAYGNYSDTGYQRYYTKMEACKDDIETLDSILHAQREVRKAEREVEKYRKIMSLYLKMLDDLVAEYPGDNYVEQIVGRCKSKLELAKMEVR